MQHTRVCMYLIGQRSVVRVGHAQVEVRQQRVEGIAHHNYSAISEEAQVTLSLRVMRFNYPYGGIHNALTLLTITGKD